ncbi:MAG: hypothetical protein NTW96_24635 [Planctomycetia bacterium]|nr:hypothetical protein [Planctomycetia bacterium]
MSTLEETVIEAARELLDNIVDAGEHTPELGANEDDYPRDADGDPWYHDCWKLYQALTDYDAEVANQ